jgi:hypothetical protein
MKATGSALSKSVAALLSTMIIVAIASGDGRAGGPELYPRQSGDRWGYIDLRSNEFFLEPQYQQACPFSGNLAAVRIEGKWGFIDHAGRMALPPAYEAVAPVKGFSYIRKDEDMCGDFTGNVAAVMVGGLWGLIDDRGEFLLKPTYVGVGYGIYSGARSAPEGQKVMAWYFHATKKYDWFLRTAEIVAPVKNGKLVGVMKVKEEFAAVSERFFPGGLQKKEREGKWGYINLENEMVVEAVYDDAADFAEGLARIRKGDRWGFIDNTGRSVVEPTLEDARDFANGLARVKSGGRWGFVGKDGKFAIKPAFDYCWDFSGDKAKVRLNDGSTYYIDRSGKTISEQE